MSAKVTAIVLSSRLDLLGRCLGSLTTDHVSSVVVVWTGTEPLAGIGTSVPTELVRPPAGLVNTEHDQVLLGMKAAPPTEWFFVLRDEEQVPPPGHPAFAFSRRHFNTAQVEQVETKPITLRETLSKVNAHCGGAAQAMVWTEDQAGNVALAATNEVRITRVGVAFTWLKSGGFGWMGTRLALLPEFPLLRQPAAAYLHEVGQHAQAVAEAQKDPTPINRRALIKSRTELETREAERALEVLFNHASLYEDLYAADQLLKYALPYTLEKRESTKKLRELLEVQIGHLNKGERDWYADGSPGEVIDLEFVKNTCIACPQARVLWLIEECRKRGFKRVVELGSLDGMNLFTLIQLAPEIEWHGVEVNPKAVAHGNKLAAEAGLSDKFHLHLAKDFYEFAEANSGYFEAVAVFEVLEHNWEPNEILHAADGLCRPTGNPRIFITTPNGAWGQHEEMNRSLTLRKDHIRAYTADRMREVLHRFAIDPATIEVKVVENPSYWEANSWVFASYAPW